MSLYGNAIAISKLKTRIGDLEDTCADLQRASRKLDLEFTELYDKVSHQMGRMAKRYATRAAAETPELDLEPAAAAENGIDPISAKILARRNRTGSPL